MPRPVRRTAAVAALALALGLGAGGCSDKDDTGEQAAAEPSESPTQAAAPAVTTKISFGSVTGRMDRPTRQRLARQVGAVVDGWTEAAYLGGDYPRRAAASAWADSWPGFTAGAKDQARRDRDLMSNQDIGDRIDGVRARRSVVVLDVLAVKGRPSGVTARMRLGFRTSGDLERTVHVKGRLFLTRTDGEWKVFGYDVSKGAVR